jgi:hypothetical protein
MWVKAKEREKNKEKHVNGAMFLTDGGERPPSPSDSILSEAIPHQLIIHTAQLLTETGVISLTYL